MEYLNFLDRIWYGSLRSQQDLTFPCVLNRWKEELISEQAVGGLEKSEHKYDVRSELVYYARRVCGKEDSIGNR